MKSHNQSSEQDSARDQLNPVLRPNFFQRTSAALNPFAFFHLSGLSALSKPKQDVETEEMSKQELMEMIGNDTNGKKIAENTGISVNSNPEFRSDSEASKEAGVALDDGTGKKMGKGRKIGIILVALIVVGVAGGSVAIIDDDDENNRNDAPKAEPFRITNVDDQERLCDAIFESDEFVFPDERSQPVFAVCQPDEGESVFLCFGNGLSSLGDDLCKTLGQVCPCEPGLVFDASGLKDFFPVCVDEIDNRTDNPVCRELPGDLAELLVETEAPTISPTDSPTREPFKITDVQDQEKLCEAMFESAEFVFENESTQPVFAVCQPDEGSSMFTCSGNGDSFDVTALCQSSGQFCPCEPGLVIDASRLDNFFQVCVDEDDNSFNNPVCVEFDGNVAGLIAETGAPTIAPIVLHQSP